MASTDGGSASTIRWDLPSKAELLESLVDEAEAFLSERLQNEDLVYRAVLLLSEAATNAMKHGNQFDPLKMVNVRLSVEGDQIHLKVCDEGAGFNLAGTKDPLESENLLRTNGRGIFLIREMADEVSFENEGRCVNIRLSS